MIIEIASFSFTVYELSLLFVVATLIGMAKTGVQGVGMIAVALLAIVLGGKASTGVMLPIMIFADIFGVYYYHQHASWEHLKRLVPFVFVGVILGVVTGNAIDDIVFGHSMVGIIFLSLSIMIWRERRAKPTVPNSLWFIAGVGITGGFATMVGNLAGPVLALYLLSMRLPKNQFIGTAAWFFLLINLAKVPFHIWVWETINWNTLILDIVLIPGIAAGALIGVSLVKKIPENSFRWFVIVMTVTSAIAMML